MASASSSQNPATISGGLKVVAPGAPTSSLAMPMAMRNAAAQLGRPCFPARQASRTQRARVSRAGGRKRRASPSSASPKSPPSPNQEAAVNPRTGKVALGPWLGPYDAPSCDSPLAPPPLFMDRHGNTYASLPSDANPGGILAAACASAAKAAKTGFGGAAAPNRQPPTAAATSDVVAAMLAAANGENGGALFEFNKGNAGGGGKGQGGQQLVAADGRWAGEYGRMRRRRERGVQGQVPGGRMYGKGAGGRCGSAMARVINQPRRS